MNLNYQNLLLSNYCGINFKKLIKIRNNISSKMELKLTKIL